MTPLYLRAETEVAMISALPGYMRSVDQAGTGIWCQARRSPRFDLCVLGPVETTPAVIEPLTGAIVTPAVLDTGFHVNLLVSDDVLADIPGSVILDPVPVTPACIFAGVEL